MYANAFKCNACGFISRVPGIHCNAEEIPVVVMDNVLPDPSGGSTTIIIREVVHELIHAE